MEIEIITTKKKLTKKIILQMQSATLEALEKGKVIGCVVRIVKKQYKTMLLHYGGIFYRISMDWKKSEVYENKIFRKAGIATIIRKFKTSEERDQWFKAYVKARDKAADIQIYV